jgi:hypothetical protein
MLLGRCTWSWRVDNGAYAIAQLENNDVFHSKILLHELHSFPPLNVPVTPRIVPIQSVHDVPLKMLEQVHFGLEIVRITINSMRFTDINCSG